MNPKLPPQNIFPALYEQEDSRHIVLFISENAGTVIAPAKSSANPYYHQIGYYSTTWISCNDPSWRLLEPGESVELIQE